MNKHKLKSCPFCGCKEVELVQYCKNGIRIRCKRCCVKFEQKIRTHSLEWLEEKMIKDWNKRIYIEVKNG